MSVAWLYKEEDRAIRQRHLASSSAMARVIAMVTHRILFLFALFLTTVPVARAQCFQSSSGALCCPERSPCSSTRCIIDIDCDRGADFCMSNVCRRPGSTPPPAPVPVTPPSPSPIPAPALVAEGQAPADGPTEVQQPGNPTIYDDLLQCGASRIRKEVRDMTDDEWSNFVNAVNELKNRPSRFNPSINQYEDLARIHTQFVIEAHGGSYFLPWHRLFILLFENALQEIDSSVSVPYWNWAVDADDPAMSDVWNRAGGSSRADVSQSGCIPWGPFANWQTNHQTPHCVRRGFSSFESGSMIPFDNWLTIQALITRDDVPFARFAAALESTHGSPHVGIGGDMAVLGTAPNDPMFFLHHAFVDYIYVQWQNNGNGIPGRFGGTNPGVGGNVRRDSFMTAFEQTVRHAQKLACVQYQEYSGTFSLNSDAFNLTVKELPQDFIETNNLNQTRINEGHEVLQEALDAALNGGH